jgi:hypothetical protein
VRFNDAKAFCEWLTNHDEGNWRYRLPTQQEAVLFPMGFLGKGPIGYWVNDHNQFVWIGPLPKDPRGIQAFKGEFAHILGRNLDRDLDRDLELDRKLELDLDRKLALTSAFGRDRPRTRARARTSALNRALKRALNRAFDRARALGRTRARALGRARAHALERARNPKGVNAFDYSASRFADRFLDRVSALDFTHLYATAWDLAREAGRRPDRDLDLYVEIFTLQERIAGRSPAFEGIRLIKERVK